MSKLNLPHNIEAEKALLANLINRGISTRQFFCRAMTFPRTVTGEFT